MAPFIKLSFEKKGWKNTLVGVNNILKEHRSVDDEYLKPTVTPVIASSFKSLVKSPVVVYLIFKI